MKWRDCSEDKTKRKSSVWEFSLRGGFGPWGEGVKSRWRSEKQWGAKTKEPESNNCLLSSWHPPPRLPLSVYQRSRQTACSDWPTPTQAAQTLAAWESWGGRPICYSQNKPLRDVSRRMYEGDKDESNQSWKFISPERQGKANKKEGKSSISEMRIMCGTLTSSPTQLHSLTQ